MIKDIIAMTIAFTIAGLLSSMLVLHRFESEHYIVVMPKSDIKKAVEDKNAGRAMKDHKKKVLKDERSRVQSTKGN